jgi:hypothetical protein
LKEYFKKHLTNFRGKKSKQKILVIESDDWGAIRIPNKQVKERLQDLNLIHGKDAFSEYDTLESEDDYVALFEVLAKHKDFKGNSPVLTANLVMGNPDFLKVRESNFEEYFWEPFQRTYEIYYPTKNTLSALLSGISSELIKPQFHAHEHLNVHQWLQRLKFGNKSYLEAFELSCFAIYDNDKSNFRPNLMATYDYRTNFELEQIKNHIGKGLTHFRNTFGFNSQTTVSPCYVWNEEIEKIFLNNNISGLQSSYVQMSNSPLTGQHKRIWRKMGTKNKFGQVYTVRNVLFEPALSPSFDWVAKTIESIEIAFFWGQPAVLSSHRLNFVAGLSEHNRTNSLKQLDLLLTKVLQRWPDIQFMNSAELVVQYE